METVNNNESGSLSAGVFQLPGEPAMVINGVPDLSTSDNSLAHCHSKSDDVELHGPTGFGEWLEGREVHKLFDSQYYSGTVTEFDKESGWYKVMYEDGDAEELDWRELKEVLLPLEITVPLKSLAQKILRRSKKAVKKSGKNLARSRKQQVRRYGKQDSQNAGSLEHK